MEEEEMKKTRGPQTAASLERRCMEWNAEFPIGTQVEYHPVINNPQHRVTKTRTGAYVLSGHTAVVFVEGVAGCVALDACVPLLGAEA
jgi:hypothetical protein